MDWGDGAYELTARALAPAGDLVVERAGVASGDIVVDVGCGTGNAALAAARRGARVTGVDPAQRLLEVAHRRAREDGLDVRFVEGDAAALPLADDAFDAAISVFAVIFCPDGPGAVRELVRVVRPGGRIAVTTWRPTGAIAAVGRLVREAVGDDAPRPVLDWGDTDAVLAAFAGAGARAEIDDEVLAFTHSSPESWYDEQTASHPMWRATIARLADRPGAAEELRARSVEVLRDANEDPTALRVSSAYAVVRAVVGP